MEEGAWFERKERSSDRHSCQQKGMSCGHPSSVDVLSSEPSPVTFKLTMDIGQTKSRKGAIGNDAEGQPIVIDNGSLPLPLDLAWISAVYSPHYFLGSNSIKFGYAGAEEPLRCTPSVGGRLNDKARDQPFAGLKDRNVQFK